MGTERTKSTPAQMSAAQPSAEKHGRSAAARSGARTALEHTLGYKFAKPSLLQLALTHRSHPYEARNDPGDIATHETKNTPGTDNEQLEFVGDAVLGLAVTELLYQQFPDRSEGELTRMRASLVSRQRMAALGAELGLDEHLLVGRSAEQNGARRKPALMANAAEAVMAAIYLDANAAGKDGFREVRRLVEQKLVKPELAMLEAALRLDGGRGALRDAKTLLQERVQARGVGRLRYADTDQSGPAHQRRFKVEARIEEPDGKISVLASAEGASKKEAQQKAAELALKHWKEPLPQESDAGRSEDAA
jgi:ribonuclease-3